MIGRSNRDGVQRTQVSARSVEPRGPWYRNLVLVFARSSGVALFARECVLAEGVLTSVAQPIGDVGLADGFYRAEPCVFRLAVGVDKAALLA